MDKENGGLRTTATTMTATAVTDKKDDRQKYTKSQLNRLEREFAIAQYPTREEYKYLAKAMAISERKVQVWFQNRRARQRRHQRKASGIPENPLPLMHQRLTTTYRNLMIPAKVLGNKNSNLNIPQQCATTHTAIKNDVTPSSEKRDQTQSQNLEPSDQITQIRKKSIRSISDVHDDDLMNLMQCIDWKDDDIFTSNDVELDYFIL